MNIIINIKLFIALFLSLLGLIPFVKGVIEDSKPSYINGFVTLLGLGASTIIILLVWLVYFIIT
jgi:hypothetical protein